MQQSFTGRAVVNAYCRTQASFDFKHIHYYTGRMPLNYEDTQIRAKCLINHVDTWKANTGLKQLAGHIYGDWGISSDNFTIDQMHEDHVIKYACIDACATYWLYNAISRKVSNVLSSNT